MIELTGGTTEDAERMRADAIASGQPRCWICGFTEMQHPNPWHTKFTAKVSVTGQQWTDEDIAEAIKASRAYGDRGKCICAPGTSRIDCPACGENKGARSGSMRTVEGP